MAFRKPFFISEGNKLPKGWHERHTYHWYPHPGLYALYSGDELVYIGQSKNVEEREENRA